MCWIKKSPQPLKERKMRIPQVAGGRVLNSWIVYKNKIAKVLWMKKQ